MNGPSVYSHQDYRKFLSEWVTWKKQVQPGFSGALFAKKARFSAHSILGMVTRGERNLSASSIRAFARGLSLSPREALYFERLVLFNQANDSEDKAYYFQQLVTVSNSESKGVLTKLLDHATYFSHWYVTVVKELAATKGFQPDPEWIARKLKRKITRKQAEESLEILLRTGMLAKDEATGKLTVVHRAIDIEPGSLDFAIRKYHREFLERAIDAVDGDRFEDREFSTLVLSISAEDFKKVREKVSAFRKQLLAEISASNETPDRVVAVNMQLISLSETGEKV